MTDTPQRQARRRLPIAVYASMEARLAATDSGSVFQMQCNIGATGADECISSYSIKCFICVTFTVRYKTLAYSSFLDTEPFAVRCFSLVLESKVYNAPPPNTRAAPKIVPSARELPNSHMLNNKLTSFRILRTMVTVKAEDTAASRFTPRMQAY